LVIAVPTAAAAQEYPTTREESLTVSDSSLAPGDSLSIEGRGFAPGSSATATLFSAPMEVGTFTADGSGTVRGEVTIPPSTSPGEHRLELAGSGADGGPLVLSAQLTITGEGGGSGSRQSGGGGFAFTGTSITALIVAGTLLAGLGAGAVVVSRRRRVAQA
jgi:hypothetical protein